MTLQPTRRTSFDKDVKRMLKRGKDMRKLRSVLQLLIDQTPLPDTLRDHALKGGYRARRELHIEPDWLLIYESDDTTLTLHATGSHSDLFDE